MNSKTDNCEAKESARSKAIAEGLEKWDAEAVHYEKLPSPRATFEVGIKYGWNAHAAAQADPWVRIDGRKENLPIREKVYWVTTASGRVERWQYYQIDNAEWLKLVVAWMPDDPPSPYTDPREGGADDAN